MCGVDECIEMLILDTLPTFDTLRLRSQIQIFNISFLQDLLPF